ncbi:MAG: YraN family protein [Chloroflexi bacterium]|nr:YraN family protein [Chloroflexota bacterium]
MTKQSTGQYGEALAADFLRQRGWRIIATNWRCPRGEIDIIAHEGQAWVFVEVRTRRAASTAAAFESVNPRKQSRLRAAVQLYLAQKNLEEAAWRIDVIAVALPHGQPPLIEHAQDALDW